MIRDLSGFIKSIESKYPVFSKDIRKDEIEENKTFFIYDSDGEIYRGENNQYMIRFYLYFVTREKKEIDDIEIIEIARRHALLFNNTEIENGKIQDLDEEVYMKTYVFHHLHRVCL